MTEFPACVCDLNRTPPTSSIWSSIQCPRHPATYSASANFVIKEKS